MMADEIDYLLHLCFFIPSSIDTTQRKKFQREYRFLHPGIFMQQKHLLQAVFQCTAAHWRLDELSGGSSFPQPHLHLLLLLQ